MAQISNIKDENGTIIYPITKTNAVLDNNNVSVEARLSALENIHLYMHSIRAFKSSTFPAISFNIVLYTTSSTAFTYSTLKDYLQTIGGPVMANGNSNATSSTTAANNANKYNVTTITYNSTDDCINLQNVGLNATIVKFTSSDVAEFLDTVIQLF